MANKLISGYIKQATQEAFLPSSLRTEFGEAMAVEISKAYRIADKTDEALGCLLYELRQAGSDEDRMRLLDSVWERHYEVAAQKIIKGNS